ncbi:Similar to Multidrug resistance protein 1A; acc. no. P21447 [Pyronema omphalodes CBS 100304]|uniref:Similar to Multidrug resistance protein 1A acc. no. P21447 n=1 Tax=Pyronema omphalodes (strain CBS 100304) TaxID=1076935 RepID=U4L973_PYROM|nr:Similar to Multidrug resistance protein 1A; acc. no. P21447 [Pyronema omphalodes CBS 100304]
MTSQQPATDGVAGEISEKGDTIPETKSVESIHRPRGPLDDVVIETGENTEEDEKKDAGVEFGNYFKLWSSDYVKPLDRVLHLIGFISAIGAGAALPLMTLVFGGLVNLFNEHSINSTNNARFDKELSKYALYFVYLFLGKFVLVYLHTTCFTIAATRIVRDIRLAYIKSIMRQEIAYFDTCTPGSVATRISTNANLIQTGLGEKVGIATMGFSMLVSAFIVAFTKYWKLTLVTATTLPAVILLVGTTVFFDQKLETQILATLSTAGGLAEEALGSIRNVVAFGAHEKLEARYRSYLDTATKLGMKKGPVLGLQYSSEFSIMYCAYALSFWYGIKLLLRGEISDGGTVFTVFFSCIIATSSLTIIAPSMGDFTKASAAAKDVLEMIAREPSIDSTSPSGEQPDVVDGRIELRNINFRYPARPTVQVLSDISITFEAGKSTALVGASGSGKSTIIALAERWYDPESGSVELDGRDLKSLNLKWLRRQMGLVQQEPVLFNDTVMMNVLYGHHDPDSLTEEEKKRIVKQACIEANADEFIEALPEGYDTVVGERASLMSGGQKQRIAIARSIVSNPRILLLDEATSALDPKAEGIVQAALDKAAKTRTTIIVAHRLATVKKADKIVVLNKGMVVEQGTYEGLLEAEGAFYRLVNAQKLSVMDEDVEDGDAVETEEAEDLGNIERVETRHSNWTDRPASELQQEDISRRLSFFRCLCIIFYEHRHLWLWFFAGVAGCILGGAVFPVQAVLFSKIVTVFQFTGAKLQERGNFWALMFVMLALATLIAYASIGYIWTSVAFIMSRVHRASYFSAMITQDISFFDLPGNSSGSLVGRLSSDPQALHDLIQGNLGLILVVIVNLTSSIILSLIIGWKLALVATFGALPILFTAGFIRMRLELSAQERVSEFFLESTRFATEAVSAIRTVQSLTLETSILSRYSNRLSGPVKAAYKRVSLIMILFGLSESVDMLGSGLGFWYGGRLILSGEYTVTQFFIVFTAIVFGGQAAGFLFGFTTNLTKAHAAANNIIHLRTSTPPINTSTGSPMPSETPDDGAEVPAIEFRHVRFTYPTRPTIPVLRNCNLRILPGERIGLVGASGCGKSTIIALLERFYDTTSGDILIHGTPLKSLDVHQYRSSVALVSQEPTLYQGSVRDNITLGARGEVNDEAVEKAARSANIHDFILSLPQGYLTDVGTKGVALSGGQRQRLAIARALVRDPRILLLDEATSALDTESERVVQEAVERASRGRTVIAVAHRLSTVREFDRVLVLAGGRVVEEGSHQELVEKRGRYWGMCLGQSLEREAV